MELLSSSSKERLLATGIICSVLEAGYLHWLSTKAPEMLITFPSQMGQK